MSNQARGEGVRDRPIIYSDRDAASIRALLDGRKTQTRRLAYSVRKTRNPAMAEDPMEVVQSPWQKVKPGDRLWVKENHCLGSYNLEAAKRRAALGQNPIAYGTDRSRLKQYTRFKWRPSIHMPRWASRLTLVVSAVKIERLQEISEEDAIAEGSQIPLAELPPAARKAAWTERQAFKHTWEALHGAGSWDNNPFVVAITFKPHACNIDALPAPPVAPPLAGPQ